MKPSNLREEVKSHTPSRGHERGGTYHGLREWVIRATYCVLHAWGLTQGKWVLLAGLKINERGGAKMAEDRMGDHFLPYKFMERTFERWANSTKQLPIASRGHQASRKAAHCLWKEVGQNIKGKKRDKRARDGDPSREGSRNRGSIQTPGNPLTGGSGGSFWISEGNLNGRKNK